MGTRGIVEIFNEASFAGLAAALEIKKVAIGSNSTDCVGWGKLRRIVGALNIVGPINLAVDTFKSLSGLVAEIIVFPEADTLLAGI